MNFCSICRIFAQFDEFLLNLIKLIKNYERHVWVGRAMLGATDGRGGAGYDVDERRGATGMQGGLPKDAQGVPEFLIILLNF